MYILSSDQDLCTTYNYIAKGAFINYVDKQGGGRGSPKY